ncbi:MAG: DEAD/DEAH box helicase [Patescibacteria group bacterium]
MNDFFGLGIAPNLLDTLSRSGYTVPTPIQYKAIPFGIQGKDLVGIAQTGTGKTLAFSIPMIQQLSSGKGTGLILLPTRELALQVEETIRKFGARFAIRTAVLIGGASMNMQLQALKKQPQVLVATPGRLIDHMEHNSVHLNEVRILVLDEADRMLDMGFAPQLNRILDAIPRQRQTMLFSATMPAEIAKMAARHMKMPVRVEIAPSGTTAERVEHELFVVSKNDKMRLLEKLLEEYHGTILVFSRTKHGAKKMTRVVRSMGHKAAEIHSDRSLAQRREALDGFKSGKYRVLIATDIAARGIDVKGIELVINYDLPDQAEDYVHRIGRTGRAGHSGKAISFATTDQGSDIRQIERLSRVHLPAKKLPELPPARQQPDMEQDRFSRTRSQRPHQGGGGQSRPSYGGGQRRSSHRSDQSHSSYDGRQGSQSPQAGQDGQSRQGAQSGRGGRGSSRNARPTRGPKKYYGGMGL